jgi:hypothetical protein
MPKIKAAQARAQFSLGDHKAVLYGDIVPAGRVEYAFLLTVFDPAKQVRFIISSEVNSMKPVMGGGSHYLCIFDDTGHSNLGDSDDWADEELFTGRALAIAYERLGQLNQQTATQPTKPDPHPSPPPGTAEGEQPDQETKE